jgi:hypothetical protein
VGRLDDDHGPAYCRVLWAEQSRVYRPGIPGQAHDGQQRPDVNKRGKLCGYDCPARYGLIRSGIKDRNYFYFNGYGNIVSTDYPDDVIDADELTDWIIEHEDALYNDDIQEILNNGADDSETEEE